MVQVTVKPEVTKPTGPAKQRARVVSLTSEFLIATVVSTSSIQGRKKSGRVKTSVGRPHKRMGWFPMLKVSVRPDSSSWRTTTAFAPNPDKLGGLNGSTQHPRKVLWTVSGANLNLTRCC